MVGEKRVIFALDGECLKEEVKTVLELTGVNMQDSLLICKQETQDWHPNFIFHSSRSTLYNKIKSFSQSIIVEVLNHYFYRISFETKYLSML